MLYLVSTARGDMARFTEESDAIAYAKQRSHADKGAFTWRVVRVDTLNHKIAHYRSAKREE